MPRVSADGLRASEAKMRAAGQPEEAVRGFARAYERLAGGEKALLASADLEPVGDVPLLETLPDADARDALSRLVVVKLNGGLATTMGLAEPKSLVLAHDTRSFLDIIVGQTLALRRRLEGELPLLLMDSEATRDATLAALAREPEIERPGLPADFLQAMIPKLDARTLAPVSWPAAPVLEWCPPGHGDVYGALRRSGLLAALRDRGIRYALISNADNLGATPDARIASFIERERIPFLMEVVEGTEADRKGGHIARRRADGVLVVRETAQTPPGEEESFRDYRHWRYYNTNNLWVDLDALADALDQAGGVLDLPLIVNPKTVDPRHAASPPVLQLESAMGAAIDLFPGARIVAVPRTRFAPVKTTDDLLVVRSDAYAVTEDLLALPVATPPFVELDPRYYRLLDDFERHFPAGPPSLRGAERLTVRGDVTFGSGVVVRGAVDLDAAEPLRIEAGAVLGG
jgi:UTP--glucose-1-phosphate uridylyltransferase